MLESASDVLGSAMIEAHRRVFLDDPYNDPIEGEHVEFRLLYRGPLRATQRDPQPGSNAPTRHWQLKHKMRLAFSRQLRAIWRDTPFLAQNQKPDGSKAYHIERLAANNQVPPWKFVPLVTHELQLLCGIDVVLLRLDHPGGPIWSGDVDNRLKTIVDALKMPGASDGYVQISEGLETDNPLFCLLEDDKLLSSAAVETAKLLDAPDEADQAYANVSITVRIRPENLIMGNIGF
jgi:hypothetical protein